MHWLIRIDNYSGMAAFVLSVYHTLSERPDRACKSNIEFILSSELIPWFVFYYFAGYELYFSVFLAIDSLCNTLKEAQAMPMIMIQLIPLAMMVFVVRNPDSTIVRIMSWFPLFTPYLMMNRTAADPPLIDMVGTTIALILRIILVLWLSGKVFRMGMLRTGQPPRLIELLRMMRQGN